MENDNLITQEQQEHQVRSAQELAREAMIRLDLIPSEAPKTPAERLKFSDFKVIMYGLSRGDSIENIAEILNVNVDTIYKFMRRNHEALSELEYVRKFYDMGIEASLVKQALGYYYEDELAHYEGGQWHTIKLKKFKAPDFNATRFYLTNRLGKKWKNLKSIDLGINGLTDEDLVLEAQRIIEETRR